MDLDAVVDLDAPLDLDGQTSAGFDAASPFDSPLYTFNGVLVTAPPAPPAPISHGGRPVRFPKRKPAPEPVKIRTVIGRAHAALGPVSAHAEATITRNGIARMRVRTAARARATRQVVSAASANILPPTHRSTAQRTVVSAAKLWVVATAEADATRTVLSAAKTRTVSTARAAATRTVLSAGSTRDTLTFDATAVRSVVADALTISSHTTRSTGTISRIGTASLDVHARAAGVAHVFDVRDDEDELLLLLT